MISRWPLYFATASMILCLCVIFMGGWTRISDSGLGCPDWPGCFGELVLPSDQSSLSILQERFPEVLLESYKGWVEMIHRYIAGLLGFLVLGLFFCAIRYRNILGYPFYSSCFLLALVGIQGAFGMWTVTMKLLPQIVTLHLIGGLTILSVIFVIRLKLKKLISNPNFTKTEINSNFKPFIGIGILVLFAQIALGGWVSTNYAGYACPGLLDCADNMKVEYDFEAGFTISQELGPNYEGGRLPHAARAAIQMTHRISAFVVLAYWFILLSLICISSRQKDKRGKCVHLSGLFVAQVILGYATAFYAVPDYLAMAHHVLAVLILFSVWRLWGSFPERTISQDFDTYDSANCTSPV